MKNTFFMLFFSIAISFIACGGSGENDENLLAGNETKGGRIPGACGL